MEFKRPYVLLEHGFFSVSFVLTNHLDMERDLSLFFVNSSMERKKKKDSQEAQFPDLFVHACFVKGCAVHLL